MTNLESFLKSNIFRAEMQTLSFIGSDKNAGKTTAMNFVYRSLKKQDDPTIVLSSIGQNGERIDQYDFHSKPSIEIHVGDYFVTAAEHLESIPGGYEIKKVFGPPLYSKTYVLGLSKFTQDILLEGPNTKQEILFLKQTLKETKENLILFLDGSIDRQFITDPDVSDQLYFSLLVSERSEQINKAVKLLEPFSLKAVPSSFSKFILKALEPDTKNILFTEDLQVVYKGTESLLFDQKLRNVLKSSDKKRELWLFTKSSYTKSIATELKHYPHLTTILNDPSLYQNVDTSVKEKEGKLRMLNELPLKAIFINQQTLNLPLDFPSRVPVYNLFRESLDEIRMF